MIDFAERRMQRQLRRRIKLILLPISTMYELIKFILKDDDISKEYIYPKDKYYKKFLCSFC